MPFSTKISQLDFSIDEKKLELNSIKKTYNKLQKYASTFLDKNLIGLNTYEINNQEKILELLPDRVLTEEIPSIIFTELKSDYKEISYFPPHVDIRRRSALNYYFRTAGEKTCFYNFDRLTDHLQEIDSFVSSDKELWALDVSIPHSVTFFGPSTRSFLSFSFFVLIL